MFYLIVFTIDETFDEVKTKFNNLSEQISSILLSTNEKVEDVKKYLMECEFLQYNNYTMKFDSIQSIFEQVNELLTTQILKLNEYDSRELPIESIKNDISDVQNKIYDFMEQVNEILTHDIIVNVKREFQEYKNKLMRNTTTNTENVVNSS